MKKITEIRIPPPKAIIARLLYAFKEALFFTSFFILLFFYMGHSVIGWFHSWPLVGKFFTPLAAFSKKIFMTADHFFDRSETGDISSSDLIRLASRHLKVKKARTLITIGGMSIGFGAIILLLSLGYGVQRLVISQVASLNEMKQAEISTGQASSVILDDEAVMSFKNIEEVEDALPLISLVSSVSFNGSVSDVVAYGVSGKYLEESALQPIHGEIFVTDDSISYAPEEEQGEVAGVTSVLAIGAQSEKEINNVQYQIYPLVWKPVYKRPTTQSEIVGYTRRIAGTHEAIEVWGGSYDGFEYSLGGVDDYGNTFNRWISDQFTLWEKQECDKKNIDCFEGEYVALKEGTSLVYSQGFITESDVVVERYELLSSSSTIFEEGQLLQPVSFYIQEDEYVALYQKPFTSEKLPSLFSRSIEKDKFIQGSLVFGSAYEGPWGSVARNGDSVPLGAWIRAEVPVWRNIDCEDQACKELYISEQDTEGTAQKVSLAYIKASDVSIDNLDQPPQFGSVLGDATSSATLEDGSELEQILLSAGFDRNSPEWAQIASQAGVLQEVEKETIPFTDAAQKKAVINKAMVQLLGVEETEVVGQVFDVTFLLDGEVLGKEDVYVAESELAQYEVVGVIGGEKTPAFYLPFGDLRSLGVSQYSQVKVLAEDQDALAAVRESIESLGFKTASVVDTVSRINSLFDNLRIGLFGLGFIALSVASLGMFNTLTVSLLEKTREVGLMKAMGMKSSEVKRLFLAESMIMGLSGGVAGLIFGFLAGRVINIVLSTISLTKGIGAINVVYIPLYLTGTILVLSFVIGFFTGLFPSRRATKISALNALRYE